MSPETVTLLRTTVNGRELELEIESREMLIDLLRDRLELTGTKRSCDSQVCGACTVHVDGAAARSCVLPVSAAAGKKITTIEGLDGKFGDALAKAWIEKDVPQCGYCQTGQIMSAAVLLKESSKPTDQASR